MEMDNGKNNWDEFIPERAVFIHKLKKKIKIETRKSAIESEFL